MNVSKVSVNPYIYINYLPSTTTYYCLQPTTFLEHEAQRTAIRTIFAFVSTAIFVPKTHPFVGSSNYDVVYCNVIKNDVVSPLKRDIVY